MMQIPHIGFIVSAYVITTVVMLGMVAAVVIDGRNLTRTLARLDPRRSPATTRARDVASRDGRP